MTTAQRCHLFFFSVQQFGRGENGRDSAVLSERQQKLVSMLQRYQVATACWQAAHTQNSGLFRTLRRRCERNSSGAEPPDLSFKLNGATCKCDSCPTISGSRQTPHQTAAAARTHRRWRQIKPLAHSAHKKAPPRRHL